MFNRFSLSELQSFTGVQLVLAKVEELGTRQGQKHILRIRAPNFGAGTVVNNMLLSMSFEALSMYPTFSDGSTVIRSVWRPKVGLNL